jgi:hypothetical protein
MIPNLMLHYLCECGLMDCRATIEYTEQAQIDFDAYCYQRDSYCLISKSCIGKSEISPDRVVVEGDDYWILEEEND